MVKIKLDREYKQGFAGYAEINGENYKLIYTENKDKILPNSNNSYMGYDLEKKELYQNINKNFSTWKEQAQATERIINEGKQCQRNSD